MAQRLNLPTPTNQNAGDKRDQSARLKMPQIKLDQESNKTTQILNLQSTEDFSFIDFELIGQVQRYCEENKSQMKAKVVNSCSMHVSRPIKFICRQCQIGLCPECMVEHFQKEHSIISIEDLVKQVQTVLLGLENNVQEILKQKSNILKKHETQIFSLNAAKRSFLDEQKRKIEYLKNYLDDRYLHIICQYNIAYEKDLVFNKNKIEKVSQKIDTDLQFAKKIQRLREEFVNLAFVFREQDGQAEGSKMSNQVNLAENRVVSNLVKAGRFLEIYNELRQKAQDQKEKEKKVVFPTHSRESLKHLSIDIDREIQMLTKKFKELNLKQEQANQIMQKYSRGNPNEEDSIQLLNQKRTQKLVVPRWFSKKMAEFDFDREQWQPSNIKNLDLPILPFASICYSPEMNQFFILGGFNNKVEGKSAFSSKAFTILEEKVNTFESIYTAEQMNPMKKQRGCFPSSVLITRRNKVRKDGKPIPEEVQDLDHHELNSEERTQYNQVFEGFIFALGGKSREDKVIRHCECYDLQTKQWSQIASMKEQRFNSSASAFSLEDGVFVFGGEDKDGYFLQTIEKYLIQEKKWISIDVLLPFPVSMAVTYKVSKKKILILGGMKMSASADGYAKKEKSADVFGFNVQSSELTLIKDQPLRQPVLSLYPCFQITDQRIGNLIKQTYVNTSRPGTRQQSESGSGARTGSRMRQSLKLSTKSVSNNVEDVAEVSIFLINEEGVDSNPSLVSYSIQTFLPGGNNY